MRSTPRDSQPHQLLRSKTPQVNTPTLFSCGTGLDGAQGISVTTMLALLFERLSDDVWVAGEFLFSPVVRLRMTGRYVFLLAWQQHLHTTGFDTVVTVTGQTVRLTHPPEDLIFIEA